MSFCKNLRLGLKLTRHSPARRRVGRLKDNKRVVWSRLRRTLENLGRIILPFARPPYTSLNCYKWNSLETWWLVCTVQCKLYVLPKSLFWWVRCFKPVYTMNAQNILSWWMYNLCSAVLSKMGVGWPSLSTNGCLRPTGQTEGAGSAGANSALQYIQSTHNITFS